MMIEHGRTDVSMARACLALREVVERNGMCGDVAPLAALARLAVVGGKGDFAGPSTCGPFGVSAVDLKFVDGDGVFRVEEAAVRGVAGFAGTGAALRARAFGDLPRTSCAGDGALVGGVTAVGIEQILAYIRSRT